MDVAAAAAAGGLGAAAAARPLSDRPPTPAPPLPSPKEESAPLVGEQAETPLLVEGEPPKTIQADAGCQEPAQEVQSEPSEPEPETESPQSSTLDSSDLDNPCGVDEATGGISDSGVLVPEYVAEETTQPGTPNDDLGESVILVSHPEQPSSFSPLPHDGSSDTTSPTPDFGITSLPSLILTHSPCTSTTILPLTSTPTDPEAEAEHLASETISLSALNSDSDSLSDSETSDSEDEAEREWRESLKELELLASMVLVPFMGKWVGRRCAYWAWAKFMTWKYPVDAIKSTATAFEIAQAAKAAIGTIKE